MTAPSPRDTFAAVSTMYGYDPATVIWIGMDQDEVLINFRLANPAGGFTSVERGFLMTDSSRNQLEGMAQLYGYDPASVLEVNIGKWESVVKFRTTQNDGVTPYVDVDNFVITEPALLPKLAVTDTGLAPA